MSMDISRESSPWQTFHMKCQYLFSSPQKIKVSSAAVGASRVNKHMLKSFTYSDDISRQLNSKKNIRHTAVLPLCAFEI